MLKFSTITYHSSPSVSFLGDSWEEQRCLLQLHLVLSAPSPEPEPPVLAILSLGRFLGSLSQYVVFVGIKGAT